MNTYDYYGPALVAPTVLVYDPAQLLREPIRLTKCQCQDVYADHFGHCIDDVNSGRCPTSFDGVFREDRRGNAFYAVAELGLLRAEYPGFVFPVCLLDVQQFGSTDKMIEEVRRWGMSIPTQRPTAKPMLYIINTELRRYRYDRHGEKTLEKCHRRLSREYDDDVDVIALYPDGDDFDQDLRGRMRRFMQVCPSVLVPSDSTASAKVSFVVGGQR